MEEKIEVTAMLAEAMKDALTEVIRELRDPRDYLTREEAAEYLRISVRTLDAWTAAGRVKRAKLGDGVKATVIYRKVDLDRFVEQRLEMDAADARRHASNL